MKTVQKDKKYYRGLLNKDRDFKALSVDTATTRFMGLAMKQIKEGETVINAQLAMGYESSSGFRDAFSKIIGAAPTLLNSIVLKAVWLDTPLGSMIAIADEKVLYILEFVGRRGLEREIERLRLKMHAAIIPGITKPIKLIEKELKLYFKGQLTNFETPVCLLGTPFQKNVWHALTNIPYAETRSYLELAKAIGKPSAFRAVALANGANQLAIMIPCHRVINHNGALGGYGGGIERKAWLIKHEKSNINKK